MSVVLAGTAGEFLFAVLIGRFLAGAERVTIRPAEYVPAELAVTA